jgi:hypothetical protein
MREKWRSVHDSARESPIAHGAKIDTVFTVFIRALLVQVCVG